MESPFEVQSGDLNFGTHVGSEDLHSVVSVYAK